MAGATGINRASAASRLGAFGRGNVGETNLTTLHNSVLYLLKDTLTPDELVFLKAITKHVVGEDMIKEILEQDWHRIVHLNNENGVQQTHD